MACYIQKPEYIQQYYVKEAWIDYDKPAQKCLKIFHLLNTKGLKHLGKDDLTDAVLEVNNGVSDELRPDVLTYMNSIWDISSKDKCANVEAYYKEEVKFYTLRQLDNLGLDISEYVDTSMEGYREADLRENYAEATPQGMIEGCKRKIKVLEKQIGRCYSYAIELFDLDSAEVEDEEYIIDGLIMENNLAYLTGAAKTGKSFLLEEMLFCIENGIPWQGRKVEQTHCLLIDFELTKAKLVKRWKKLKEKYSALYPGLPFKPFACVSMVGSWGTSNVTLDSIVEFVKDMSRGNSSLGVVALDPFYRFVEGDENSNEDVQETINKLMPLKQRMTVIYTHHTKKNSMDKDPLTNGSGAGSHGRAADISMGLSGDNAKGFHLRYSGREDLGGITLSRDEYGFFVQSEAKESETGYKTELDDDTWAQIAEYVGDRTVSMTAFRKKFGNIDYDLLRSHGYVVEKSSGNYKIRKRTNMSKG